MPRCKDWKSMSWLVLKNIYLNLCLWTNRNATHVCHDSIQDKPLHCYWCLWHWRPVSIESPSHQNTLMHAVRMSSSSGQPHLSSQKIMSGSAKKSHEISLKISAASSLLYVLIFGSRWCLCCCRHASHTLENIGGEVTHHSDGHVNETSALVSIQDPVNQASTSHMIWGSVVAVEVCPVLSTPANENIQTYLEKNLRRTKVVVLCQKKRVPFSFTTQRLGCWGCLRCLWRRGLRLFRLRRLRHGGHGLAVQDVRNKWDKDWTAWVLEVLVVKSSFVQILVFQCI